MPFFIYWSDYALFHYINVLYSIEFLMSDQRCIPDTSFGHDILTNLCVAELYLQIFCEDFMSVFTGVFSYSIFSLVCFIHKVIGLIKWIGNVISCFPIFCSVKIGFDPFFPLIMTVFAFEVWKLSCLSTYIIFQIMFHWLIGPSIIISINTLFSVCCVQY